MASIALLTADALTVVQQFINGPQWGVFLGGQQVIGQGIVGLGGSLNTIGGQFLQVAQSSLNNALGSITGIGQTTQMGLEFEQRFAITTAPQEGGAFMSYNLVQTPYRVGITFVAGGLASNRALLRTQVQSIMGTTNLYTALTPEGPIASLVPVGMAYRRQAEDVGILEISVLFAQVRPAGNAQFSTTATPNSATGATAPVAGGTPAISSPAPAFAPATSVQSFGAQSAVAPTSSFVSMVAIPRI